MRTTLVGAGAASWERQQRAGPTAMPRDSKWACRGMHRILLTVALASIWRTTAGEATAVTRRLSKSATDKHDCALLT